MSSSYPRPEAAFVRPLHMCTMLSKNVHAQILTVSVVVQTRPCVALQLPWDNAYSARVSRSLREILHYTVHTCKPNQETDLLFGPETGTAIDIPAVGVGAGLVISHMINMTLLSTIQPWCELA